MAGGLRKASKMGAANATTADLVAVLVAVTDGEPKIMTIANAGALPSGPFEFAHRSLQTGLRAWVEAQTGHPLGYVEQLYTFADRGRGGDAKSPHSISISYLGLTREDQVGAGFEAHWSGWYDYFPWEDQRSGLSPALAKTLASRLRAWSKSADTASLQRERWQRVAITFGLDEREWNEELVLQRYELLYEAGLIEEARRDGREAALARKTLPELGEPMRFDHRRILATAIARLRAKLKYRPVVFELMPREFTLTELQRTVEAISGRHLHKQNFRRLVETAALVEPTGETSTATGGRPAAQYRFRREVVQERPAPGLRLGGRS